MHQNNERYLNNAYHKDTNVSFAVCMSMCVSVCVCAHAHTCACMHACACVLSEIMFVLKRQ